MRYTIQYNSYQSSKKATDYSRERAEGTIVVVGIPGVISIGVAIWYIYAVVYLFGQLNIINYIEALIAVLIMSGVLLYSYVIRNDITDRECRLILLREEAERIGALESDIAPYISEIKADYNSSIKETVRDYYISFLPGLVGATGLIGCIKSINMICHQKTGFTGLIISLIIITCSVLHFIIKARKEYALDNATNQTSTTSSASNAQSDSSFYTLCKAAEVIVYVSLGIFLILLFRMAPGVRSERVAYYIIIAIIAIGFVVLFKKLEPTAYERKNKTFYWCSLIIALIVVVLSIVLRITYEAKIDSALKDVPNSGSIYVSVNLDEEFYSPNSGYVSNPRSSIRINDTWYEGGEILLINLNQTYPIRVSAGYDYEGGYIDTSITFATQEMRNGFTKVEYVPIETDITGEVTMNFSMCLDFWSVIAH